MAARREEGRRVIRGHQPDHADAARSSATAARQSRQGERSGQVQDDLGRTVHGQRLAHGGSPSTPPDLATPQGGLGQLSPAGMRDHGLARTIDRDGRIQPATLTGSALGPPVSVDHRGMARRHEVT